MMHKHLLTVLCFCAAPAWSQTQYVWQHNDVTQAWRQGYQGQGTAIHIHDDFRGSMGNYNLDRNASEPGNSRTLAHGEAVSITASRTAPQAQITQTMFNERFTLVPGRLNIVNASYGSFPFPFPPVSNQLTQVAREGSAVVVKAAGNGSNNMSFLGGGGQFFWLGDSQNMALRDGQSVIFAGALVDNHGTEGVSELRLLGIRIATTTGSANRSFYSNYPGPDPEYQKRFLMVGVRESTFAGTSFAAPQISGYAAVVGSKFRQANPQQVVAQLLNTARTDTIRFYNPYFHGRGEASLSRALAPSAIR